MSERKPFSSKKARRVLGSGSARRSSSSGTSMGTSSFKVTSSRETRACSANSSRFSRRLGCLISPARARSVSRSPYSPINCAAVLTPIPGTPGTLSVESPASAWTSITLSGPTPKRSTTSSGPMERFFMGSSMATPSPTSCIMSLSEETMVTSSPRSRARRA